MLLEEDLEVFFEDAFPNYFMTTIWRVRRERQDDVQGTLHVDGTARYQTINKKQNEKTYNLLKYLKK